MGDFENWKNKLNLKYTFGMSRTDGASRRYHDENMNIGAECHTSKNEETQEWGKSEWTYYSESSNKEHDTLESLFSELDKKEGE